MKTTVVPAQVTTVEDKIAGNLNFTQILLMTTPVFLAGAIFAFLPPFMNLRGYKLIICIIAATVFMTLAIRIKGKILLVWIGVIGRYNLRPRYYIFNKNDLYLRNAPDEPKAKTQEQAKPEKAQAKQEVSPVPIAELVHVEDIVNDPRAKLEFRATKKGGLRVHIQEIK